MAVDDLDVCRTAHRTAKAHAVPVVHADTVLADAVALERFEPVSRRHAQIVETPRDLQLPQLASRYRLDAREARDPSAARQRRGVGAAKRHDHDRTVTRCVTNDKRE
jgi:hypothetical protein